MVAGSNCMATKCFILLTFGLAPEVNASTAASKYVQLEEGSHDARLLETFNNEKSPDTKKVSSQDDNALREEVTTCKAELDEVQRQLAACEPSEGEVVGLRAKKNSRSLQYNASAMDLQVPIFNIKAQGPMNFSRDYYYNFHLNPYAMKIGIESGLFEDVVPNWRDFRVEIDMLDSSLPPKSEGGPYQWTSVKASAAMIPELLRDNILGKDDGRCSSGAPATAIFGATCCDGHHIPLASAANVFGVVYITGYSSSPELADERYYPLFLRTSPSSKTMDQGYALLCTQFGWNRVAALYSPAAQERAEIFASHFHEIASNSQVFHAVMVEATLDPSIDAHWDEAWLIAIARTLLRHEARIILYLHGHHYNNIVVLSRYLYEYGLLGPEYVWLANGIAGNFIPFIIHEFQRDALSQFKKIAPSNPMWQSKYYEDSEAMALNFLGMMWLDVQARGSRFYSDEYARLWTNLTRDQLKQAGAKHLLDDSHYDLDASALKKKSWRHHASYMLTEYVIPEYNFLNDALLSLYVAIGKLLAAGTAPEKIEGKLLYDMIRNSPFEGMSGLVNLTSGSRLMNFNLLQNQPIPSELSATNMSFVPVGLLKFAEGSLHITGTLRFADGTAVPPRDRRLPCEAGTQYDESARQCFPCSSGRYSPESDSKCFPCPSGKHSSMKSNYCQECAFGEVFDSEVEGGNCRVRTTFIVALVCTGFLGFVCIITYFHRSRISHWIRFRRTRAKIPGVLSQEYLCTWKIQDADLQTLVPPQEYLEAKKIKDIFRVYQDQLATAGKWTSAEASTILSVSDVLLRYFALFSDALLQEEAKFQHLMRHSYQRKRKKYMGVYNSVLLGVIMDDDAWPSYPPLIREVQGLVTAQVGAASGGSEDKPGVAGKDTIEYAQNILAARKGLQPSLTEDRHSLIDLMQHSLGSQAWLATLCNEIAKAAKATASGASQKGLYRCLEKFALERRGRAAPVNRCRDAAREMIMCKDVSTICNVLQAFVAHMRAQKLIIVSFKDRFQHPTDGGWSDCLLSIVRVGDPVFHVAEVQIVHDDMMAVRRNMGAHEEYNEFRAIAEIFDGLGWSLQSDPEKGLLNPRPLLGDAPQVPLVEPEMALGGISDASLEAQQQEHKISKVSPALQ